MELDWSALGVTLAATAVAAGVGTGVPIWMTRKRELRMLEATSRIQEAASVQAEAARESLKRENEAWSRKCHREIEERLARTLSVSWDSCAYLTSRHGLLYRTIPNHGIVLNVESAFDVPIKCSVRGLQQGPGEDVFEQAGRFSDGVRIFDEKILEPGRNVSFKVSDQQLAAHSTTFNDYGEPEVMWLSPTILFVDVVCPCRDCRKGVESGGGREWLSVRFVMEYIEGDTFRPGEEFWRAA